MKTNAIGASAPERWTRDLNAKLRRTLWLVMCALLLASAREARAQLFISEFLADNQLNAMVDDDGSHSDWLEIWNKGTSAVSLNGWYLTDIAGNLRKWQFPTTTPSVTLAANARILVFASAKDRKVNAQKLHTNFKLAKEAGSYLALVRPDGLTIEHQYNGYPQQVQDVAYGMPAVTSTVTLLGPGSAGRARVPLSAADMPETSPVTASDWRAINFADGSWQAGAAGFGYDTAGTYGSLIGPGGDLQSSMHLVNSTALIRIPFRLDPTWSITSLKLSMKHDDGYVCYLNGALIATNSAPSSKVWNSQANSDRPGQAIGAYANAILINALAQLANADANGNCMLAFQMLNFSNGSTQDTDSFGAPNGSRALCLPLLEATVNQSTGAPTYLAAPTPKNNADNNSTGANGGPLTALGPLISDVTGNTPPRPTGSPTSAPIIVTAKVVPSLNPLAATDPVTLKYRLMQAVESSIVMRDNGVAPDAVAGDSIFTASLPTTNIGPGMMLRWRIEARDNASTPSVSTEPPFLDPTDNDQYFGTVTEDGITTSALPILHWFVADDAAARTEGGTRCSLFFLGRFYDNVFVGLHGQSSSGFAVNKKSHDFNFSEDNRFKWKEGQDRQRAINLITTWADKSHVRDALAWETWQRTRHIASHWVQTVRVQQNGAFWGLYDMVENGDKDFLSRAGLDPLGALYKVYNSLQDSTGVEKKTREFEDNSDLQALVNAMGNGGLATRRSYSYDNVDVPALVNYLATNVLVLNNDFGHKNYYIYRDTNGTREWSLLPWDQDLTIGHTWTGVQNYFNDDIHTQAGLVIGASTGNRLMNLVMNSSASTVAPEMAQMFMRRLRTLMDEQLVSATATNGPMEQRINQMLDAMDPPGAAYQTDADLDLQKWGYWLDGGGGPIAAPGGDAATHDHGVRRSALRILNANPNPPYPADVNNAEGLGDTTLAFLPGRRSILYNGNLTHATGATMPAAQSAVPQGLTIEHVDFNPGNADQEFFIIRNNSGAYVDVSGWKITGAVDLTFRGGTVIPPFTTGSAVNATGDVHTGRLHVARNPYLFRQRAVSPKGGEYRLVVGPYDGRLSARGGTVELRTPDGALYTANTFTASPTPAQNFLRVTEVNFAPKDPTPSESAALTGVQAGDFEFVELTNTGSVSLALSGAQFDRGITFTFPTSYTLSAGARCLIVSNLAAFNLRYGSGMNIAGQFEGSLDNSGEELRILDSAGEEVLKFTYDPAWYPPTDKGGYSLVVRSGAPPFDGYNSSTAWAISGQAGGSPGGADASVSQVFEGWRHSYFTSSEENTSFVGGLAADPEGDGRTNFKEYAFGFHPRQADPQPDSTSSIVEVGASRYLAITFLRAKNALDVTYTVEVSPDLTDWTPVDLPVGSPQDLSDGRERVTYRDSMPENGTPRFIRARAMK